MGSSHQPAKTCQECRELLLDYMAQLSNIGLAEHEGQSLGPVAHTNRTMSSASAGIANRVRRHAATQMTGFGKLQLSDSWLHEFGVQRHC